MRYKVTYITGGGTEHSDGEWVVRKTPKRTVAEKIKESGVYDMHEVGEKIRIGFNTGNPIRDGYEEHDFIYYFKQAGTPYHFEPLL